MGQVATGTWSLNSNIMAKKPFDCPATFLDDPAPEWAVLVTNNTGKAAVVQVYNSGTGKPLDTVLVVYNGTTFPASDAELKACAQSADDCDDLTDVCGNVANQGSTLDWAGMDDVAIPAGGSIIVVTNGYTSADTGPFNLNIKTKALN